MKIGKKINIDFDLSNWKRFRNWKDIKKDLLCEFGDYISLLWKGFGFILGIWMVTSFHWILIILLLVWLLFDVHVNFKEVKEK